MTARSLYGPALFTRQLIEWTACSLDGPVPFAPVDGPGPCNSTTETHSLNRRLDPVQSTSRRLNDSEHYYLSSCNS